MARDAVCTGPLLHAACIDVAFGKFLEGVSKLQVRGGSCFVETIKQRE